MQSEHIFESIANDEVDALSGLACTHGQELSDLFVAAQGLGEYCEAPRRGKSQHDI